MKRYRTALITGASGGIGQELARALAQQNYRLVLLYHSNKEGAVLLCEELLNLQCNCVLYQCDISNFQEVQKMQNDVKKNFGIVDTIINNAAISTINLFQDETESSISHLLNTNINGSLYVTNCFLQDMIDMQFGRIVNIASVWGQCGASMEVVYSTSKAAMIGFTKSLAQEVAPSGITVNAVSPGLINTKMNAHLSQIELNQFVASIPVGKMGSVQDVANAVLYFLKEESSYVTGQILGVNGGLV